MFMLYLDDSGSARNESEQHLVLAGVSVFERIPYFISQELDALVKEIAPDNPDSVELHASEIYRGKTPPWESRHRRNKPHLAPL